jgi:methionyl-tRNA formyltransferase
MKVERGLDSGPVFKTESIYMDDKITAGELHDILMHMGAKLVAKVLESIAQGKITPMEQDSSQASYAPMLSKSMSIIDWDDSCRNVNNLIRGLDPWPGSVITYETKEIKIFNTSLVLTNHGEKPGTILEVNEQGICIACRDGYIIVREIQLPGKKRMPVKQFLLGNKLEIGYMIGDD